MNYSPLRGILVNNESELIIGGQSGNLSKYSINNPAAPLLIKNIKLSNCVNSIVKISEDTLLFG